MNPDTQGASREALARVGKLIADRAAEQLPAERIEHIAFVEQGTWTSTKGGPTTSGEPVEELGRITCGCRREKLGR